MRLFAILLAAAVTMLSPVPLVRADLEDGNEAFHRGDFVAALEAWRAPAAAGDVQAQLGLGRLLLAGGDMSGVDWIRRSADGGHLPAEYWMARSRVFGLYAPQDVNACVAWLSSAVGHPEADVRAHPVEAAGAQLMLSFWYGMGVGGLERDLARREALLRASADGGNAEAQLAYGVALLEGQEVKRDVPRAYLYIILSWKQGWKGAREQALALRKRLKPEELEQAKALAREWLAAKDAGVLGWAFAAEERRSLGERRLHQIEEMHLDVLQQVMMLDILADMPCKPYNPTAARKCPERWLRFRGPVDGSTSLQRMVERWTVDNGLGTRSYRVRYRPGKPIGGEETIRWEVSREQRSGP